MSASVFSLPIPLILLVHLHILEYPHANKPEYDHNIFEPRVRGLRDRTKLLEDVAYFLVGRLEDRARTILATYPCTAPSDTVSFRTSLSKYLETLRHNSIYSTAKPAAGLASSKLRGGKDASKEGESGAAWWWKDVVVRKSLLEECAGERFERLLLSVSTHALLKGTSLCRPVPENTNALLRSQPILYAELLAKCKAARHTWTQSASVLLHKEEELRLLRKHLRSHVGEVASKYSALSTERLAAFVQSKYQNLVRRAWSGQNGQLALEFLAKAAGLDTAETSTVASGKPSGSTSIAAPKSQNPNVAPQPLPVAAAHHPSYLKKIRKPIFSTPRSQRSVEVADTEAKPSTTRNPGHSVAAVALAHRFESEARRHQALTEALSRGQAVGRDLVVRAKVLEAKRKAKKAPTQPNFSLDLWQPDHEAPVNFDTKPTPDLLAKFGLHTAEMEGELGARIDEIRDTVLPAYPPVPDFSAPRLPAAETGASRIPRAGSTKATSASVSSTGQHIPGPSVSRPITSTPPPTAKPLPRKVVVAATRRASKAPKKSIRFSLAIHRRPSLFSTGNLSDEEDVFESDVNRIIHSTQDDSMGEEELHHMTPKPKTPRVNRIFTGARGGSTVKRPKQPFPMVFKEPAVPLPSLVSGSTSFDDFIADSDDDEGGSVYKGNETAGEARADDEYRQEEPSMTLREILLSADTTQFALMEDEQDFENESFEWD
ncbi:hypothetical protein DXG03_001023 [Asterophora parasitica]|uniref:HAUS augmin-like complex subunit 6 N-terminal domain-containing protein n=1 Tax=Asterophora parasitica TaxID=117018 RepID=A0A9P7G9X5_9AGAR|nr:hypothetical protein DXG03_001023 [Asterophora parasitica]